MYFMSCGLFLSVACHGLGGVKFCYRTALAHRRHSCLNMLCLNVLFNILVSMYFWHSCLDEL